MERLTRQRRAVIDALVRSGQALSPPDLQAMAKSSVPTLNLSTVYRQIRALEDIGKIVRVELPGQPARFEMAHRGVAEPHARHRSRHHSSSTSKRSAGIAAPEPAHHHHFHCVECDRVYPIHACPGPMQDLAPPGFEVQRHDLTLRGRCADCATGAVA
jgi:Fur family ferric uptake transcriptional regulator